MSSQRRVGQILAGQANLLATRFLCYIESPRDLVKFLAALCLHSPVNVPNHSAKNPPGRWNADCLSSEATHADNNCANRSGR